MKSEEEIRQAILVLGTSFANAEVRRFVWGASPEGATRAWAAFNALGWVAGADEAELAIVLQFAALKLQQYGIQQEENHHAGN